MRELLQLCAKLEHNVAVVFDHADFSAQSIARGPSIVSMKRRAGDGRMYHNTNMAHNEDLFYVVSQGH